MAKIKLEVAENQPPPPLATITISSGTTVPRLNATIGRQKSTIVHSPGLHDNNLTGSIDPFGNLTSLQELSAAGNIFDGGIPNGFGRLKNLQKLALGINRLSGVIPPSLFNLSSLTMFDVIENQIEGSLPWDLGYNLPNIEFLNISDNQFTGSIPVSMSNASKLHYLITVQNKLTGKVPNFERLQNLEWLSISDNQLGSREAGDLSFLSSLTNATNLQVLGANMNNFGGILPESIGNLSSNLEVLYLDNNQISGSISPGIANILSLQSLYIQELSMYNSSKSTLFPSSELSYGLPALVAPLLSGQTSTHVSKHLLALLYHSGSFKYILLSTVNGLTGQRLRLTGQWRGMVNGAVNARIGSRIVADSTRLIAAHVCGSARAAGRVRLRVAGRVGRGLRIAATLLAREGALARVRVCGTRLWTRAGHIPAEIGKLQNLRELNLINNKLSGNIPSSLGNLSLLNELILGINDLQGSIPSSLGECENLQLLFLSQNNLSGTIPKEVVAISSLSIYLHLSQNQMSGSLPVEVGNLINLGSLDVSGNLLSGEIPSTLGSCGHVPSSLGFLRGIRELDLSNNNLSGEIPEYLEGFDSLQKLNLSFNNFEGAIPTKGVFSNSSRVSVVGNRLGLVVCTLYICWFRKTTKDNSSADSENSLFRVTYQSLLQATNGFSSSNLIGAGSFGSAYKGVLDGRIVAVKVLNLLRQGASKSFISECEALRNIRHRNLVKVLTACSAVDYQGNDFKALIYEFMVNGSLEEWLHPNPNEDVSNEEFRKLNLLLGINITIDVACALNYLHNHGQTPIVHCDLKPSNILLDKEMSAHVGDFGLAKFLPDAAYDSSINETGSIAIRGSIGYTAPEYSMGSVVSTYGDVYSFGILLLEMFTRKRPTDEMFKDALSIHGFVKKALSGDISNIADPTLIQQAEDEELPREMDINDAIAKLHSIKNSLLECDIHG
ncbi:putative receptor-like protein kinase At3g47110 [Actinidia eriantha]|uniref:putative receptor-like protein kinase At3g47110 n=1 Tax=Actinidia eriantha TaxID=165200 RepID=UPI002583B515|nr:putative receptor-like protein kinase At3g47110 [Actinidia eriantha]